MLWRLLKIQTLIGVFLVISVITANAQSIIAYFIMRPELGSLSGQAQVFSDISAADAAGVSFGALSQFTLPNPGSWSNITSNLANMASDCGNLTNVFYNPHDSSVIAGVANRSLWSSTNGGSSWSQLGGSTSVDNRMTKIVFDPSSVGTYWEAGIYGGQSGNWGGIYKTTNNGQSFQQLGTITHIDDISVDFTDSNRQTIVATGHEQKKTIYKTTNGGQTWTNIGANFSDTADITSSVHVFDAQTYLINVAGYAGGDTGIYKTVNGGQSWQRVSTVGGRGQHYFVKAPNGTLYIPTWGGILRSTDNGNTWSETGGLSSVVPTVLQDNRVISVSGNRLVVSSDNGASFTPFGAATPYNDMWGVIADPSLQSFYIWRWDCGNIVLPNAIMKLK